MRSRAGKTMRAVVSLAVASTVAFLVGTPGTGGGGGDIPHIAFSGTRAMQTFANEVDFFAYQNVEYIGQTTTGIYIDRTRMHLNVYWQDPGSLVCTGNPVDPPRPSDGANWGYRDLSNNPVTKYNSPRFVSVYWQSHFDKTEGQTTVAGTPATRPPMRSNTMGLASGQPAFQRSVG